MKIVLVVLTLAQHLAWGNGIRQLGTDRLANRLLLGTLDLADDNPVETALELLLRGWELTWGSHVFSLEFRNMASFSSRRSLTSFTYGTIFDNRDKSGFSIWGGLTCWDGTNLSGFS